MGLPQWRSRTRSSGRRAKDSLRAVLQPGREATIEDVVTDEMSAERLGSGDVPVLGTPAVLALAERAAIASLAGELDPGRTTVGARVDLLHLAPTPVGSPITAMARLEGVDGPRLSFRFEVSDPSGVIARGTHLRVVVERDPFVAGAERRRQPR